MLKEFVYAFSKMKERYEKKNDSFDLNFVII